MQLIQPIIINALVVGKRENVRYLSGFTGTSGALRIGADEAVLLTDSRYAEQAAAEAPGFDIEIVAGPPALVAAMRTPALRVGFEPGSLGYDLWERMRALVEGKRGGSLIPCSGAVEALRVCKDPAELVLIEKAVRIASEALEEVPDDGDPRGDRTGPRAGDRVPHAACRSGGRCLRPDRGVGPSRRAAAWSCFGEAACGGRVRRV